MNEKLIGYITRKYGSNFNGITESKHSHIDGNDLVFRSDVHKVFKQILPEIIALCADEAIEAVKDKYTNSPILTTDSMFPAISAIEKRLK